jgi:hypothetical protein
MAHMQETLDVQIRWVGPTEALEILGNALQGLEGGNKGLTQALEAGEKARRRLQQEIAELRSRVQAERTHATWSKDKVIQLEADLKKAQELNKQLADRVTAASEVIARNAERQPDHEDRARMHRRAQLAEAEAARLRGELLKARGVAFTFNPHASNAEYGAKAQSPAGAFTEYPASLQTPKDSPSASSTGAPRAEAIKPGDVVRLKSSSAHDKWTVEKVEGGVAHCLAPVFLGGFVRLAVASVTLAKVA